MLNLQNVFIIIYNACNTFKGLKLKKKYIGKNKNQNYYINRLSYHSKLVFINLRGLFLFKEKMLEIFFFFFSGKKILRWFIFSAVKLHYIFN